MIRAFNGMARSHTLSRRQIVLACLLLGSVISVPASAQDYRGIVFGNIGGASIGHADSEQGKAPTFGAGAGVRLMPRLLLEGDLHGGRVSHVFGREDHDFSQVTFTARALFRSSPTDAVHFIAGGGFGLQRAHVRFNEPPFDPTDRIETIRLLHGRLGVEWELSRRVVLRTEGVLWFSEGVDWVAGARAGLGYRF